MNRRTFFYSLGVILLLTATVLVAASFFNKTANHLSGKNEKANLNKTGKTVSVDPAYLAALEKECAATVAAKAKADSIKKAARQDLLSAAHDSIVILNYELKKCREEEGKVSTVSAVKKVVEKKSTPKKIVKTNRESVRLDFIKPEIELAIPDEFKPVTKGASSKKSSLTTEAYRTSLEGGNYVGLADGDFYATISPDGYLEYVFSQELYNQAGGTGIPELNYKGSGMAFILEGDVYVYKDVSTPIASGNISNVWVWSVCIGPKGGYDAFLPHELLKTAIIKTRGSLAGTISQEDVIDIGEYVPEVKTGRIKPNKITAVGDYDRLAYEGWSFCTPVLYREQ